MFFVCHLAKIIEKRNFVIWILNNQESYFALRIGNLIAKSNKNTQNTEGHLRGHELIFSIYLGMMETFELQISSSFLTKAFILCEPHLHVQTYSSLMQGQYKKQKLSGFANPAVIGDRN